EGAYHPNNRGFDHFSGFLGGSRSYFPNPQDDAPGQPGAVMLNQTYTSFEGYYTDVLADQTVDFIEANRDSPFFAFLSFNAVHTPMEAREDDLARFAGHPRQTLAAMTWAMDRAVGNVLDSLRENGLTERTLIFFLSDNGGAITNDSDNGALKGWKGNKFEGGHRVPMIVQWEGHIEGGRTFDGLVSAVDILPTAVGVTGETVVFEKALDGVDLLPYLQGTSLGNPHEILFWRKEDEAAVRQDKWKLIHLDDFGYVLYDLGKDLGETEDVKERSPEKFEELKSLLMGWKSQLMEPLWHEPEPWLEVTWEIHEALMQNKQPMRNHP
ncbi:MAG TPA: sulfatase-like hydrolase/transferase, partial [Acidobacteriota bacterium]|nr:sulfatase-like hydrolase/transferase [Acidobacteriota bacterium]